MPVRWRERLLANGPLRNVTYARLDKVKKSVEQHSATGRRGYYEFIKKYV